MDELSTFNFEIFFGDGCETEVSVFRCAFDLKLLQEIDDFELYQHVVLAEHLLAGGQATEFLNNAHVFHKIDIGIARNAQIGLFTR